MKKKSLILASASPRRVELLKQMQVEFEQQIADVDETPLADETAEAFVCRLSLEKAQTVSKKNPKDIAVLGSDTIVVVDEHILGKPEGYEHAVKMLKMLSNRTHQVMTAVTLITAETTKTSLNISDVTFMQLDQGLIDAYWQTGESIDKAGAYAIQGIGGQFVREIKGSYSAIMGLPLYETRCLLHEARISLLGDK